MPPAAETREIIDIYAQEGSQYEMITSPATEVFMGGESGAGKSFGFLLDFLEDIDKPKADGLFLRRHYPDLEGVIHDSQSLYRGYGGKFNDQKHIWTFPSGARLQFGSIQHAKDVFKFTGRNRTHYYWDELTQFPRMPYILLMAWLRSTDPTIFKRIRGSGNPDGEGYLWVKARFIDALEPFEIAHFTTINDRDTRVEKGHRSAISRQFIPGIRAENKALMDMDPEYEARLDLLPEDKKRAYKYGIWDYMDRPFQLIKTKYWSKAINRQNKPVRGLAALGADYAESGDLCTFCHGVGGQVRKFAEFPGMDTDPWTDILLAEADGLESAYGERHLRIGVDSVGVGAGVYHRLKKSRFAGLVDPMRYKDPTEPIDGQRSYAVRIKFNNLRSQMWWKLAEDFRYGRIDLSLLQDEKGFYDNLHLLQEELLAHTYEERNGVIIIISKTDLKKADKLGRSPDRADALAIWNWVREKAKAPGKPPPKPLVEQLEYAKKIQERRRDRQVAIAESGNVLSPDSWQAG